MQLKVIHTFPEVDVEEFEDLLENEEFNQQLAKLPNISKRTLVEDKDLGEGKRHTVVVYETRAIPANVKKILGGDGITLKEEVDFNRNTHIHHLKIIPSLLKERLKCEGKYIIEPLGPAGGAKRTIILDVKVKIFGMGRILERAVSREFKKNSREEERLSREYIKEHLDEIKGKSKKKSAKKPAAKKTTSKKK